MRNFSLAVFLLISASSICSAQSISTYPPSTSFYQQRLEDPEAVYFTPENFAGITADGKTDVSDALQQAVNQVKTQHNFGVLFIPEGTYMISKTIYVPQAVRIIGYGKNRPMIILGQNSPGYQVTDTLDKGQANYMFWYTSGISQKGRVSDAGAGTFYSAMSNIDLKIENDNPQAVALRTHYAQHSFISHVNIYIGNGKAGMFDVGNEMEDVRFYGGDYGIYTTKPSPGWQFTMVDDYFEGQRKAAIRSQEGGLTMIRLTVKNVPTVIEVNPDRYEKIFMEDSQLESVSGPAFILSNDGNAYTQFSLRNVDCNKVPILMHYRLSGKEVAGAGPIYKIRNFLYGLQMADVGARPVHKTIQEMQVLQVFPPPAKKDIPALPEMATWVNLKSLGAVGDGVTDDTKAIQAAIDQNRTIYVPQGWYRVSETIKMKSNTILIGLNPIATQFIIKDNEEVFGSFGGPKPLLESSVGGNNILSGIGLFTGNYNNRAVACKWMAGANSYMNDVKFVGGHGTMTRPQPRPANPPAAAAAPRGGNTQASTESGWDGQYWSLWITNGGGGTFKDIWSASTSASSGIYVSNTSTPGRMYEISVEHHVRNEVRFKNVSNWKVYALQLEEESRESSDCQPLIIEDCKDMVFAQLWMFRVVRINVPYPNSILSSNNKNVEILNVHHYSQIKYTTNNPLYDVNSMVEVRPWEFNRLYISGKAPASKIQNDPIGKLQQIAKGFEFADGITKDSKGNIYFSETRMKRIYKWSADTRTLSLIADFQWEPFSLGTDKNDNLLVVFKYQPRPGYLKNGQPEVFRNGPDAAGTSYAGYQPAGVTTLAYSIDPKNPEETIRLMDRVPIENVKTVYKTLNPANRRRDSGDFTKVSAYKFKDYFVAPDGMTVIPVVYDIARSNSLVEGYPGKTLYGTDEYLKRTYKLDVGKEGYLSNPKLFAERGEFCSAVDKDGNVYIADGQVYVYDKTGKLLKEIDVPERPSTMVFGGKDGNTLYITARSALYSIKVK